MTGFPLIFVISLPGSARRQRIQRDFDSIGLPFQFWDGVHGAQLDERDMRQVDTHYTQREWGHGLNAGEIGCALSHIRLYEHMVAEEIASAIIFEDDSQPVSGFKTTLEALLDRLPSRAELAFLHHGKAKSWPWKTALPHGHKLVRYRYPSAKSKRTIISARGYWLSRSGARKLLDQAYPVRMPADYLTGYIQRSGVHAYGVEPNLLVDNEAPSEIDTISQRDYGTHKR